jgi:aldose 1-epimerase
MDHPNTLVTLRADRASAGIAPSIGGSITHFHWQEGARRHDWLRPASADDLAACAADRLACFPLVPFSNRIRGGRFSFGGHAVALPLNQWPQPHAEHGHGWQAPWSVSARADDSLTPLYEHAADDWPFPYRARQDIALTRASAIGTITTVMTLLLVLLASRLAGKKMAELFR